MLRPKLRVILSGPEVAALLQEHLDNMALHSPPESVHALDLEGLRGPEITFWSARLLFQLFFYDAQLWRGSAGAPSWPEPAFGARRR